MNTEEVVKQEEKNGVNREYKDRLFKMVFKEKKALLSLYNAVNGSDYTDESKLEVNTIEEALYLGMKNDVSFLVDDSVMNFYEHQSTLCANMPVRGLIYAGIVYRQYIESRGLKVFSRKAIELPMPKYIVFYNGETDAPDVSKLRLTDLFKGNSYGDFEWTATMMNINYGHNKELMEKCRPLMEYSIFVSKVREFAKSMKIDDAVDMAVKYCIEHDVMADFLRKNRAEVKDVFLTEYDEKKVMNDFYEDGFEDGIADEKKRGEKKVEQTALKLLKRGMSVDEVADILDVDIEVVKKWRNTVADLA